MQCQQTGPFARGARPTVPRAGAIGTHVAAPLGAGCLPVPPAPDADPCLCRAAPGTVLYACRTFKTRSAEVAETKVIGFGTWLTLEDPRLVVLTRGTRPYSPMQHMCTAVAAGRRWMRAALWWCFVMKTLGELRLESRVHATDPPGIQCSRSYYAVPHYWRPILHRAAGCAHDVPEMQGRLVHQLRHSYG